MIGLRTSSVKFSSTRRTENRLIVENLSTSVSWQDLKDFFRKVGEVTYTEAHTVREREG